MGAHLDNSTSAQKFSQVVQPDIEQRGEKIKWSIGPMLEVLVIIIWAIWIGRNYLNFNPFAIPAGVDFPSQIQNNFILGLIPKCGICFLWNGFTNGGAPGFGDLIGSAQHPLVALLSLLFGIVNGIKLTMVACLITAGLAQWWLARVMRLGWLARTWSALMVVVCGHLGGRLGGGMTNIVLGSACASLMIAPVIDLTLNRNRKAIIWMGIALALTILSGQGYIQVGIFAILLPSLGVFLYKNKGMADLWKKYAMGVLLGCLLAGYYLIPVLHFFPFISKEGNPTFNLVQTLGTILLNFLRADGQQEYCDYLFVGWVPVILAVLSYKMIPRGQRRLMWFFIVGIGLSFLMTSLEFLQFLHFFIPQIEFFRYPGLMNAFAVPLLLGMAAWEIDLLQKETWPKLTMSFSSSPNWAISLRWIIIVPLILAIHTAIPVGPRFFVVNVLETLPSVDREVMLSSVQWVHLPKDNSDFDRPLRLIPNGIPKFFDIWWRDWEWKDHNLPTAYKEVTIGENNLTDPDYKYSVGEYNVLIHPQNQYAAVQTNSGLVPCDARSLGGNIDMVCSTTMAGKLTVQENSWTGWYAWVDSKPVVLGDGQWLNVAAPAGNHSYQFRYWPLDVLIGCLLSLCGVALALRILFFSSLPTGREDFFNI